MRCLRQRSTSTFACRPEELKWRQKLEGAGDSAESYVTVRELQLPARRPG
jgi:hypothetical protein